MKHKVFIAGIIGLATALSGVSALADSKDRGGKHGMSFSALDTDGDGQITRDEMENRAKARFTSADTNGDGILDRAELDQQARDRASKQVDKMLERMDANGDGALSQDELPKGRAGKMFERADADGSGGISQEEFAEMRAHGKRHKNKNKN